MNERELIKGIIMQCPKWMATLGIILLSVGIAGYMVMGPIVYKSFFALIALLGATLGGSYVYLKTIGEKINITVTDKRVYGSAKAAARVDLPLDSISSVSIVGKSSLRVATSSRALDFILIKNAEEIYKVINELLINRQNNAKEVANDIKPAMVTQTSSNADELKKYKELLDNGVISQEEFDAKKKQLLGL